MFSLFYFIYGFERVWACLLCNVCVRLVHIPSAAPVRTTLPLPSSLHPNTVARISSAMCDRVKVPPSLWAWS